MRGLLYCLTFPSGKSYIGITTKTLAVRVAQHVYRSRCKNARGVLLNAIRGHAELFTATVLSESDDWAALCNAERAQIKAMRTMVPHGFNLTAGGDGVPGYRQSPDQVRARGLQVAAANKRRTGIAGKKMSAEHKERLRELSTGRSPSPETRVKMSVGRRAAAQRRKAAAP